MCSPTVKTCCWGVSQDLGHFGRTKLSYSHTPLNCTGDTAHVTARPTTLCGPSNRKYTG